MSTSTAKTYTSRRTGIIAGIMLMLTLVVPVGIDQGTPFWLLQHDEMLLFVPVWLVGLGIILAGRLLDGWPLSIWYFVLAILGAGLLVLIPYWAVLNWAFSLGPLGAASFFVVNGVRSRLGASRTVCMAQIIVSALALALTGLFWWQALFLPFWLLRWFPPGCLFLHATAASLGHGFAMNSRGPNLTVMARASALVGLLWVWVFGLGPSPAALIWFGLGTVVVEGFTSFISELGARARGRHPAGVSSGSL